ncbi:MAG: hypothetical protein ACOYNN_16485 [Terrimicrobiaceae bacterium]
MNKGVQILLERMNSNPNEFIPSVKGGYPAKWRDIILSVEMRTKGGKDYADQLPFLNDKEIKALWHKMQELQGELFTKRVMDTLLRDAEDGLDYSVTYAGVMEMINNLSPKEQAELSLLSRQVTGGSPKGKF